MQGQKVQCPGRNIFYHYREDLLSDPSPMYLPQGREHSKNALLKYLDHGGRHSFGKAMMNLDERTYQDGFASSKKEGNKEGERCS